MPAHWIGDIGHGYHVGDDAAEIEGRRDHQKPLRPGEPGKLHAKRAAYLAAGAVGANQPARGAPFRRTVALERDMNGRGVLFDAGNAAAKLEAEVRV